MKRLNTYLPVQFKVFGGVKPIESQSFETELEQFRQEAYSNAPKEKDNLRCRCLIDNGINSIKTLLSNLWKDKEQRRKIKKPRIEVYLLVDNEYTVYRVAIIYSENNLWSAPQCDHYESEKFGETIEAEKDELLDRYGFKEPEPIVDKRKFRVSLSGRDAIMTYSELCNFSLELGPDFHPIVEEIK